MVGWYRLENGAQRNQEHSMKAAGQELLCNEALEVTGTSELREEGWNWELLLWYKWMGLEKVTSCQSCRVPKLLSLLCCVSLRAVLSLNLKMNWITNGLTKSHDWCLLIDKSWKSKYQLHLKVTLWFAFEKYVYSNDIMHLFREAHFSLNKLPFNSLVYQDPRNKRKSWRNIESFVSIVCTKRTAKVIWEIWCLFCDTALACCWNRMN